MSRRAVVLRPLAGIAAAGFVFLLFAADDLPLQRAVMVGVLAVAFALYAVGGVEIAERWLGPWVGGHPDKTEDGR